MRRGSCSRRNSHSSPARDIHAGARLTPADDEVEAPADADRHGRAKPVGEAIDPELLLGSAERNEHQVRTRGNQSLQRLLRARIGSIGTDDRGVDADDSDVELTESASPGLLGDTGPAPEQVHAPLSFRRQPHQREHQIRA